MGCYMSTPDNRVYVTEGRGKDFTYATASCQGWRREQEDAEDCLPNFDENASLFILCDGHGGAEVAKYTVQHLPNFIKNHPLYKEGKYEEALEKAFIDFDALLRTPEVMDELHKIAFDEAAQNKEDNKESKLIELKAGTSEDSNEDNESKQPANSSAGPSSSSSSKPSSSFSAATSSTGPSTVVEDVDPETLKKEAQVPLKQLIKQYSANANAIDPALKNSLLSKYNSSPVVKARRDNGDEEEDDNKASSSSNTADDVKPSTSLQENDDHNEGPSTSFHASIKESMIKQILQRYFPEEDSSDDSEFDGENSSNDDDGDDEGDDDGAESSTKKLRRKKRKRPINSNETSSDDEDDDNDDDLDDDDDSKTEDDDDDEEDDDDDDEEEEEEEDEADNEEEDEQVDEEDEDEEYDESKVVDEDFDDGENPMGYSLDELASLTKSGASRTHTPGLDSGCTTVVALVRDGKLYVASAGDSRCIMIMRTGECKPMSFDHKPEDAIERRRIHRGGGTVTEGRVNGGLNLSRALGDFTYKSEALDAKEQIITPCPDVKVADLDPERVEYIFLACDGIWNSMKNQQATKFIRKTAPNVDNNLVDICVKLFRECIAPRTDGDGTGCDNMTCILAKFQTSKEKEEEEGKTLANSDLKDAKDESIDRNTSSHKRSTNEDENSDVPTKKRCIRL